MSRPPLPPRRSVPTVPNGKDVDADVEIVKPLGIAARIASLQLEQKVVGRNSLSVGKPPPPPVPRARTAPQESTTDVALPVAQYSGVICPTRQELASRGDDYLRLISRPPPPPPTLVREEFPEEDSLPPPPPRRLPPMPTHLPTPPPEPVAEPEAEYNEEASCLKCHDFSYVDAHAAQFPRHTVHSLDSLAYDLTSPFESETEKCRALFTWMHHNIMYDCESFFSGNLRPATAESTLQSGLAVCDGYAGLFVYLAERAGLQAMKVGGHGKGFGYAALGPDAHVPRFQGNHAWNCVLMDGDWHLIDCCWGAGALEGSTYTARFTPFWFSASPAEFGHRHFPEDPGYQLIAEDDGGPVSWEQYILEPEGPTIFNDFYELTFHPYIIQPAEQHIQSGAWVTFQVFKFCEHMSRQERDNYVYFINTPDGTRTPLLVGEEGGWAATIYLPSGGEVSLYYVKTCDQRDALGLGVDGFERANGRKAMSFGGMLRWIAV